MSDYQLNFDIAAMPNLPLQTAAIMGLATITATLLVYMTRPSPSEQGGQTGASRSRFFASQPAGQPGSRLRSFALKLFFTFVPVSGLLLAFWIGQYLILLDARLHGRFQVVEGCLTAFHSSNPVRGSHDIDRIQVAGHGFAYPATLLGLASFNQAESEGGPIHADSRVRLAFVGNSIIRVETVDQDCPPAPDPNP